MECTWAQRLARGAVSGFAGGVASAVILWIAVEPALAKAIALESAGAAAHGHTESGNPHSHSHETGEVVTRLQQQIGATITVIVVAAMMGLAFSVVYASSRHRLPGRTDLSRSLLLGGIAFSVLAAGPALIIPASPPGVGDPDTVNHRTLSYLLVIGLGVLLVAVVFALRQVLDRRQVTPEMTWLLIGATSALGMGAIVLLVPAPADVVPHSMPTSLVWHFRTGSLAQLGAMWGVIGLVHGVLVQRAVRRRRESAPATVVHA